MKPKETPTIHSESLGSLVMTRDAVQAQSLWCVGLVAARHVGSLFPNQESNMCPLDCKEDSFFFNLNLFILIGG